jgi:hypothetical protein
MISRTGLAQMLSLDQARLNRVLAKLGPATYRSQRGDKMRRLNLQVGERLAACSARERPAFAQAFAEADADLPVEISQPSSASEARQVEQLRKTGCAPLGRIFDAGQIKDILDYLRPKPVVIGAEPADSRERFAALKDVPRDKNYVCYDYLDLWSSPHLLEGATQARLLDLVQGYLGCTPTLDSVNAFWLLPNHPAHHHSQVFHRDEGDSRSLTIFTLLTPVETPEEGAHYYVEMSHDAGLLEAFLRADGVGTNVDYLSAGPFVGPMASRLFARTARRFDGAAGTSFCYDGYGLHRSVVPRSRPHLLLAFRFGTFFNEQAQSMRLSHDAPLRRVFRQVLAPLARAMRAGRYEQIEQISRRIPADLRHQYVFRYMVRALSAEI